MNKDVAVSNISVVVAIDELENANLLGAVGSG